MKDFWKKAAPGDRAPSEVDDSFDDAHAPGRVIGSTSRSGARRMGVDVEGVISIDNGALRIAPLRRAGWGRAAIAYGPFERRAGLTFAVFLLNGHNTSQAENLPESLP